MSRDRAGPPYARRASDDPFHDPATRLGLALDAAGMGDWSWDFETDRVTFSERSAQIFGVPAGTHLTWSQMREHLHPEDAERARLAVEASMQDRTDYAIEYRVLQDGGYDRWISARGCAMYDDAGHPRGMLGVVQDVTARKQMEEALRLRNETLETVNRTALLISAELDLEKLVSAVTDAATKLTGASFGAFFYNVLDESGSSYTLYSLSGVDRKHFENFPMPRATEVFGPTFRGEGVVRSGDITRDPRYGHNPPHAGMPAGHLPVVSYLAVPVITRSGEVLGGLFFGHPQANRFSESHETIAVALAAQAAVALDNARLYEQASRAREAASREEAGQRFLVSLHDSTRGMAQAGDLLDRVVAETGRHFEVSRCTYSEMVASAQHSRNVHEYTNGVPSVAGRHRVEVFGAETMAELRAGRTLVIDDTATDARTAAVSAAFDAIQARAVLAVPLIRDGQLSALLTLLDRAPRVWSRHEITLLEQVAQRTWFALESAHAQAQVRESRDVLALAMRSGRMGVWSRQLSDDSVWWSPELEEIFGLPAGSFGGSKNSFIELVHDEDRPAVLACVQSAIDSGQDYSVEFRFRHASGELRWMDGRGRAIYDANGRASMLYGLGIDITERMQSLARLKEADARKSEFLAVLAHELRNPLAPIRNAVEFLQRRGPDDAELVNARAIIGRQVTHLVRLVDDLLDVSRISRGLINLQRDWITLSMIVANAVEVSRPLIVQQQHQLEIDLPLEPVYLEGDLTRLAQVLQNLLNNAAKYTPPGGHIGVHGRLEHGLLVLRVTDNGAGIPQDMLGSIFELFVQADRTLERTTGGLGIGLTLVQRIVELHGGTVEARSAGPGRGSELIVRLPASSHPFGQAQQPATPAQLPAPRPLRVLVVDDNCDAAETLGMLLELQGHQVCKAHDGAAGVAAVENFQPDAVLLDIGLPKLNGYDAARAIRALPGGDAIKLVAITGWGQEEDRRRSQAAGFDHHLVKPIAPAEIDALLQKFPRRSR